MASAFFGELIGTAMLIFLGNGVVAGVQLEGSYARNGGWLVITTAWGIVVTCSVLVALAIGSNAHINPAVTIGMAFYSQSWSHVPIYLAGQFLGAFLGAVLVWIHYLPHWSSTDDAAAKRSCFCTSPAVKHTPSNLFSEISGSFVLIFVVAAIYSDRITPDGLTPGLGPFLVGLVVWAIGLCLGGTTGYAINPARDLGPRIAHAVLPIAGKGDSGWEYAAIPVVGPIIGGSLAAMLATALGM
jgi:glycerol uptake facilitator protein